jgi:hypothetical protein
MNIPGFTAENSASNASGHTTAGFGTSSATKGLSIQASPMALAPGLGRGIDLFPSIRCCRMVPGWNHPVCVTGSASPLENCFCTRDFLGYPEIRCRGPVIAPPE